MDGSWTLHHDKHREFSVNRKSRPSWQNALPQTQSCRTNVFNYRGLLFEYNVIHNQTHLTERSPHRALLLIMRNSLNEDPGGFLCFSPVTRAAGWEGTAGLHSLSALTVFSGQNRGVCTHSSAVAAWKHATVHFGLSVAACAALRNWDFFQT